MPVDVSTSIQIQRPRDFVSAYASDPSNAPDWYINIRSVEWRTEPVVRVGSRVDFVAQFLGRRLAYTYEITEFSRGELLVMRTSEGPFPMETRYTWTDLPADGTLMTLRNRGAPKGFAGIAAPFVVSAMRRANRKDLKLLKELLEQ
jgi:uncharacterized membrane protein